MRMVYAQNITWEYVRDIARHLMRLDEALKRNSANMTQRDRDDAQKEIFSLGKVVSMLVINFDMRGRGRSFDHLPSM